MLLASRLIIGGGSLKYLRFASSVGFSKRKPETLISRMTAQLRDRQKIAAAFNTDDLIEFGHVSHALDSGKNF